MSKRPSLVQILCLRGFESAYITFQEQKPFLEKVWRDKLGDDSFCIYSGFGFDANFFEPSDEIRALNRLTTESGIKILHVNTILGCTVCILFMGIRVGFNIAVMKGLE